MWAGWIAAAVFLAAALIFRPSADDHRRLHLTVTAPGQIQRIPVLSPDGRHVAFAASRGSSGRVSIWVRSLSDDDTREIPGSEGGDYPFWSPDSRHIAFIARGKLYRASLMGGAPQELADAQPGRGGTWGINGDIVFQPTNRAPLARVSASGGALETVTTIDTALDENSHRYPHFLPDGRHFLFTARVVRPEETSIYAAALGSSSRVKLLTAPSNAVYSPTGHLLFARNGALFATQEHAFSTAIQCLLSPACDTKTRALSLFFHCRAMVASSPIVEAVMRSTAFTGSTAAVRVSNRSAHRGLTRRFGCRPTERAPRSPFLTSGRVVTISGFWIDRGIPTPFTFHPATDWRPVWSAAGHDIFFASERDGLNKIFRKSTMSASDAELVRGMSSEVVPKDTSADGEWLYGVVTRADGSDIVRWRLHGDGASQTLVEAEFSATQPRVSPDGKLLAYQSNESGQFEIYVRSIDEAGVTRRVSSSGGLHPQWRGDGREIFYLGLDRTLMSVPLDEGGRLGSAVLLFQTCTVGGPSAFRYGPSVDGERFLFICPTEETPTDQIEIVVNWASLLEEGG